MNKTALKEPLLTEWLNKSIFLPNEVFHSIAINEKLMNSVIIESKAGIGFFIKKEFDPYRGNFEVIWEAHVATPGGIDLLKGSFEIENLKIELLESANFVLFRIPESDENVTGEERKKQVREILRKMVNTHTDAHQWSFDLDRLTEPIPPGGLLLSNNQSPPVLRELFSRHERADILLFDGHIYFIFYKKIEQLEDFRPLDQWFSSDARQALK